MAADLAAQPFQPARERLPASLREIDRARHLAFHSDASSSLWSDAGLGFDVQFLPTARQITQPVTVREVSPQGVREVRVGGAGFLWGDLALTAQAQEEVAIGGLRVRHVWTEGQPPREVALFLGASQFQAVGRDQVLGASARAVIVNPAALKAQEQPRFTAFWLVRPALGDRVLQLYALLDGPTLTGAYRFVIRPGIATQVDVQARLFARTEAVLGLAPVGGTYVHGENQPAAQPDIRPEVHGVDGLSLLTGDGEWIWRPLVHPQRLLATSFSMRQPKGYGLLQRDRQYASYQDPRARWQDHAGVWVEPADSWGAGRVELVQMPTPDATNHNILAYWVPGAAPTAGRSLALAYRTIWHGDLVAPRPPSWVTQSRRGPMGQPLPAGQVRFAVDFEGPALAVPGADTDLTAVVSVGEGGELVRQELIPSPATGGWRIALWVQRTDAARAIELRAVLQRQGKAVSETWSYILPPG